MLLEGGPGTGKTSTVAAMINAVQQHCPQVLIHLAAPTGKAAARLGQATGDRHPCSTLHRLLEQRGDRFLRNRHHPMRLDLLIVDETGTLGVETLHRLLLGDAAADRPAGPAAPPSFACATATIWAWPMAIWGWWWVMPPLPALTPTWIPTGISKAG